MVLTALKKINMLPWKLHKPRIASTLTRLSRAQFSRTTRKWRAVAENRSTSERFPWACLAVSLALFFETCPIAQRGRMRFQCRNINECRTAHAAASLASLGRITSTIIVTKKSWRKYAGISKISSRTLSL